VNIRSVSGAIWVVFGALFAFGFVYNLAVAWLQKKGYDEGYTAILVVFGVLVTLAGVAVVDLDAAILCLMAFVASGFWMVVGGWWRYAHARENGQAGYRRGDV
jgi:hypothetical protein